MTTVAGGNNVCSVSDESLFISFVHWVFEELQDEGTACSSSDSLDSNTSDTSTITSTSTYRTSGSKGNVFKSRRRLVHKISPTEPLKWNVFRSFEKSDALLHFPSTFARLSNSGEGPLLGKLVKAYCTKNCKISLPNEVTISVAQFVDFLSFSDLLFPDSMTFMHTTEIANNQIDALFYFKYTDTEDMHTHADAVVQDPFFKTIFVGPRSSVLGNMLSLDTRTEVVQHAVNTLVDLNSDLQIYGCLKWTITLDPVTKKFVSFNHLWSFTEVCCDNVRFKLD